MEPLANARTWIEFDFQTFKAHESARYVRPVSSGEGLMFAGAGGGWHYLGTLDVPETLQRTGALRVRAAVNLHRGSFAIGILNQNDDMMGQGEMKVAGPRMLEFVADCSEIPKHLVFRAGGLNGTEVIAECRAIQAELNAGECNTFQALRDRMLAPAKTEPAHPLFAKVSRWSGSVPKGMHGNWLGVYTDTSFGGWNSNAGEKVTPDLPELADEYFEWIDLLEAADAAKDRFVFVELGAGFGRWLVNAVAIMRRLGRAEPVSLVGIEAEPTHYEYMIAHLRNNDIDPDAHRMIRGAVAPADGYVHFAVGHAEEWWGQSIVPDDPEFFKGEHRDRDSAAMVRVPAVSLATAIEGLPIVDLIHMDIQGSEHDVLSASADLLNARVKRLHIGTHSSEIEDQLRVLLLANGWECLRDYRTHEVNATPYGDFEFGDGIQSWVNPRLR